MSEFTQVRLARASRIWIHDTELGSIIGAYAQYLSDRGYAPQTVSVYLESVAHFAHWCAQRRVRLAEVNEGSVTPFLNQHLLRCHCAQRCQRTLHSVRAALTHLLDLLRSEGRIGPKASPDPPEVVDELHRFRHHLTQVCGLSSTTISVRLQRVRAFLLDLFPADSVCIGALKPVDVARFLRNYTQGWTPASKRAVGNSLSSYFRFKSLQGEPGLALCAALPRVAQWRLAGLPKGLSPDQVTRLLKAFDRNSGTGKRDYAITRCLVDLGLRAAEVARLRLDDVEWQEGIVRVRGKGQRDDVLPLPSATGRAIVDYLRHGRPHTRSRALFLRHRPPLHRPATASVVRAAVRYAAARCGMERCFHGPHTLRHTLAQQLLQGRTSLKQIADLLRHRSLDTTTIYAKVDLPALRGVALPWPGGLS